MLHSQPNGDIWKHWRATYTLHWSSRSYFCTKHPFHSWYSHFPISISSGALWDFHTAAVSLRCPRLVASVPKLSVPLGRDAYLCCSSKIQSPHRQIRPSVDVVGCDKIPLEALPHDHCSPQLLKYSLLWPWQTLPHCYVFKMLLWICQFQHLTLFVPICWLPPSAILLSFLP